MKSSSTTVKFLSLLLLGLALTSRGANVTNTVVATCCSDYLLNSTPDPILTLTQGVTYVFVLSTAGHPFWIKTNSTTGTGDAFDLGVTNNGAQSGNLILSVKTNTPLILFYHCGIHSPMGNQINTVAAPTPPAAKIVFLFLGSNGIVTMKSTGTTGFTNFPEYNCNVTSVNWSNVPSFTNTFSNGTNTMTFNRLDSLCGSSNVFLRVRTQ